MIRIKNSFGRGNHARSSGGITLLELLIAVFMASIVLSAAFGLYITQHNQYLVQEDVSEIQANARAAAELLASDIRKSGFMLPPVVTSILASNTNPDTILVRYATSKIAGAALSVPMITQYDVLVCSGNDLQELARGDWVYIYDTLNAVGEAFVVTDVDCATLTIQHAMGPLDRVYPLGSQLFDVESDKYYVDAADTSNPCLMIKRLGEEAQIFVEGIERINFTYYMADGTDSDQITNPDSLRMIGIDVTAKSEMPQLNSVDGQYRSRSHFLKVKLRNFGLNG